MKFMGNSLTHKLHYLGGNVGDLD